METMSATGDAEDTNHFTAQTTVTSSASVRPVTCSQPGESPDAPEVTTTTVTPVGVVPRRNSDVGNLSSKIGNLIGNLVGALQPSVGQNCERKACELGYGIAASDAMATTTSFLSEAMSQNQDHGVESTKAVPDSIASIVDSLSSDQVLDTPVTMATQLSHHTDITDLDSLGFTDKPELVPGDPGVGILDTDQLLKTVALSSGENSMFSANNSDTENLSASNGADISKLLSQVENSIALDTSAGDKDDESSSHANDEDNSTITENLTTALPVTIETDGRCAVSSVSVTNSSATCNEKNDTNSSSSDDIPNNTTVTDAPSPTVVSMETEDTNSDAILTDTPSPIVLSIETNDRNPTETSTVTSQVSTDIESTKHAQMDSPGDVGPPDPALESVDSEATASAAEPLNSTMDSEDNKLVIDESAGDSEARQDGTDASRETIEWTAETMPADPLETDATPVGVSVPPSPEPDATTAGESGPLIPDPDAATASFSGPPSPELDATTANLFGPPSPEPDAKSAGESGPLSPEPDATTASSSGPQSPEPDVTIASVSGPPSPEPDATTAGESAPLRPEPDATTASSSGPPSPEPDATMASVSGPMSLDGKRSSASPVVILDGDVGDENTGNSKQSSPNIEPIVIAPDSPETAQTSQGDSISTDQQSGGRLLQELLSSSGSKTSTSQVAATATSPSPAAPTRVGLFMNQSVNSSNDSQSKIQTTDRRRASLESTRETVPSQTAARQRSVSGDAPSNCDNSTSNMPMIMEVFGGGSDKTLVQLHSKGSAKTSRAAQNETESDSVPAKSLRDLGKSSQSPIVLDDYEEPPIDLDNLVIKTEKVDSGYGKAAKKKKTHIVLNPSSVAISTFQQSVQQPTIVYSIVGETMIPTTTNSTLASARNHLNQSLSKHFPQALTYQTPARGAVIRSPINMPGVNQVILRPGAPVTVPRQAMVTSTGLRSIIPNVQPGKQGATSSRGTLTSVTLVLAGPTYTSVQSAQRGSKNTDSGFKVINMPVTCSTSSSSSEVKVVSKVSTPSSVSSTATTGNKVGSTTSKSPAVDLEKLAAIVKRHKDSYEMNSMVYEVKSPPPELLMEDIPKSSKFYCRGCNSHFLLKSTLSQHQLRRTMCIKYECSLEKGCRVLFYNPCQLNLHLRLHRPSPNWKSKIDIKGLPEDMVENKNRYDAIKDMTYSSAGNFLKHSKKPSVESSSAQTSSGVPQEKQTQKSGSSPKAGPQEKVNLSKEDIDSSPQKSVSDQAIQEQTSGSILENAGTTPVESSPSPVQVQPHKAMIKVFGKPTPVVNTSADTDPVICVECGMSFITRNQLASHMTNRSSNKKLFFCKTCPVVLRSKCAQQAHSRIHKNAEPYVCPECGQVIHGSHKVFWKHLHVKCAHHIRQATFNCLVCSNISNTRKALAKHIFDTHIDNFYKCLQCPMAFRSEDSLRSHARQEHVGAMEYRKISKCGMCDAVYNESNLLIDHLITAHIETNPKMVNVVNRCNACNMTYTPRISCISHMEKEHKFYFNHHQMCHVCGVEIKASPTLFYHLKTKHPQLTQLDKELTEKLKKRGIIQGDDKTASKIEKPETMHIPASDPPKRRENTSSSTESKTDSNKNPTKSTPPETSNTTVIKMKIKEEPGLETPEKVFSCSRCQTEFSDAEAYQRHMAKHRYVEKKRIRTKSDDLVLKIKLPKLSESDSSSGSVILKTEPTSATPKIFTRQVPDAPEPEPQFYCSECAEGFHIESDLNSHLQEIHSMTRQFPCHLCGMTYESTAALKAHFSREHEGTKRGAKKGNKPFVCYICQEQDIRRCYTTRPQLIKHLISLPHKIPRNMIDYTRFPDAGTVKSGQTKGKNGAPASESGSTETHDNQSDTSSIVGDPQEAPPIKRLKLAGDSNYSCAKCAFTTESREAFVEHIKKHQTQRTQDLHQCKECGLTFAVLPTLKKHLFVVHKIRNFTKYLEDTGIDLVSQPKEEEFAMPKQTANPPIRRINGVRQPKATPSPVEKPKSELDVNECTVCYKLYDSEHELRTHMRTHGMAFIRSKRLDLS